jgi:CarD family transcriptional regulator
MWSRRAQEYEQKINSGKIYELAEVVKDLNKTSNAIADQSYSERQLFEKAYDRLQSEFEVVLQISQTDVKKKMDKVLGRNQNLEEE